MDRGFEKVRLLEGGLEGWLAAGFEVEEVESAPSRAHRKKSGSKARKK